MKVDSLPPVFTGLNLPHVYRVGSEYRGPCPRCGGDDRFILWERSQATGKPLGWCRQCEYTWRPETDKWVPLTPEEIEAFAEKRRERAEDERREREQNRAQLRSTPVWQTYHENLSRYPNAGDLWHTRYGLREWATTYYRLGYCPSFNYFHDGEELVSETLTIPYFEPATHYRLVNLRHRLLDTGARGGKYRPHRGGLGQPIFYANLNRRPDSLPFVLIVEGAIKAAVIWQEAIAPMLMDAANRETEWFVNNVQVIAIPGTSVSETNLPLLTPAEQVYIAFDPDANERVEGRPSKAEKLAAKFEGARVVSLPGKPDDLIVEGSLTVRDLVHYMKWGRWV